MENGTTSYRKILKHFHDFFQTFQDISECRIFQNISRPGIRRTFPGFFQCRHQRSEVKGHARSEGSNEECSISPPSPWVGLPGHRVAPGCCRLPSASPGWPASRTALPPGSPWTPAAPSASWRISLSIIDHVQQIINITGTVTQNIYAIAFNMGLQAHSHSNFDYGAMPHEHHSAMESALLLSVLLRKPWIMWL